LNGTVHGIEWFQQSIELFDWSALRHFPALKMLDLGDNRLSVIDFHALPRRLEQLSVSGNLLSGTIDWAALPPTLKEMRLVDNQFSGTADLSMLPPNLVSLGLFNNKLEGALTLPSIHHPIQELYLPGNKLTGSIDLTNVPQRLEWLFLRDNQFLGPIILSKRNLRVLKFPNIQNGLLRLTTQQGNLTTKLEVNFGGNPMNIQNPQIRFED